MACNVVTISRSLGAFGEDIGRQVAKGLRFAYIDDEIVVRAAERAGVSPETIAQVELGRPLIQRILEAMAAGSMAEMPAMLPRDVVLPVASPSLYQALIEQVIRETASRGKAVILAHGASIPLAGMEGLLRVFVTASPDARAERVAKAQGLSRREAEKAISSSDKARADFLHRFYNVRQELPVHYDLVVNTDSISSSQAAAVVLAAAEAL
jgi:hypothetical protein